MKIYNCAYINAQFFYIEVLTMPLIFRKMFQYKTTLLLSIGALIFLLALSGVILWNAVELHRAVNKLTEDYLEDVAAESAKSVDTKFHEIFKSLNVIADSVSQMQPAEINRFIARKTAVSNFIDLAVAGEDGVAHFAFGGSRNIEKFFPFSAALKGEFSAGTDGKHIFYAVPIPGNDRKRRVLIGVKSKQNMQYLISGDFFSGEGSSAILNQKGEIIVPPVKKKHTALIRETKYLKTEEWAIKMLDDLGKNLPGRFILPTLSGRDIFVDYRPLSVNGWFLTVTVPTDILTTHADVFISRTFYGTLAMAAAFLIITLLIICIQNHYRVKIENISFYDPVTDGISNICFLMRTQEFLDGSSSKDYAVVSVNLRNLGLINEYEGRSQGDKILRRVYNILADEMKKDNGELVTRGNAGTFYIFMQKGAKDKFMKRLNEMAEKIAGIGNKSGPIRIDTGIFCLSDKASFKIAEAEVYADTARKSAERSYLSTFTFYDEKFKKRQLEEVNMLNDIERAIEERKFTIHLQPKVCAQTGLIAGAEALVRWKHPKLGFVSPAAFIPVCEKNGIISRLDQLVFEEVCRTLAEWKESGIPLLPISVNISRQQLKNPSFFNDYRKIAEEAGVARGLIEFELTESLMLVGNDFKNAREVIEEIHSAGFTCSLDDFGSGYSSLGLLKDLKIDCLKLDRMFFANRFEKPETRAIIESIIILAKKLNIATVAEGVEYKEQVELLRTIGCDLIQGFYFFRPVPVREFERIVLEEAGKPPTTD